MADYLSAVEVREHTLARGFAAVRSWIIEILDSRRVAFAELKESSAA
jgi:hypothetical protein